MDISQQDYTESQLPAIVEQTTLLLPQPRKVAWQQSDPASKLAAKLAALSVLLSALGLGLGVYAYNHANSAIVLRKQPLHKFRQTQPVFGNQDGRRPKGQRHHEHPGARIPKQGPDIAI